MASVVEVISETSIVVTEETSQIVEVFVEGTPQIIEVIAPGPQGVSAVTLTYPFTSDTSVSINHDLGFYPMVQVFDTDWTQIQGEIIHTDTDNLVVNFNSAISGTVVIK